jgi:hypothetical protein
MFSRTYFTPTKLSHKNRKICATEEGYVKRRTISAGFVISSTSKVFNLTKVYRAVLRG